jgi:hypothetical protein
MALLRDVSSLLVVLLVAASGVACKTAAPATHAGRELACGKVLIRYGGNAQA